MSPELKTVVVFEMPDAPKLLVKPLLSPVVREARCHTFVKRRFVLPTIPLRVLSEAKEIPPEVIRVSVGVICILRLLKKSSPRSKLWTTVRSPLRDDEDTPGTTSSNSVVLFFGTNFDTWPRFGLGRNPVNRRVINSYQQR